ncbi:16S rRNA (adenine(1518)-N(6)/adenine(1519)-N(6))-dimethyltransferase RsmA [Nitratiruptor sp. YY09-18]|uniref:16S rRNA (adenine(1518)-N(6)/adenine(1519)-N(6))- dimethyltransferase RsmA n=1 Tax=Nitratiruptor sp. YY09-18 TaxID=2724901 RepID=UPI0019153926|nr:16S rRNA (adenine(1518)-N(6)/adenine(1519)-N(6))-dimethyltransferase RsmA [Nitratiruptor sp. YY09-18]BCD67194.1 16S rRNA (adenine1518-N6/adenine1519-N6)-dimethyltransferase [Nitratiruptor sp. YY09-18]
MEVVAKKRFGQNFLKDRVVLEKIIQSMPKTDNIVVEIGPGLGDLTQKLLEHKDVIAFEIDKDLCRHLQQKFAQEISSGRLKLICGDVIDHWKQHLVEQDYDLVANLPYYVATNIVLKALSDERCKNILVMLQKEVADKFSAKPGAKEFSSLAVLAQSVGEVKRAIIVKPSSFSPPPKVDSAVLAIQKHTNLDDKDFMEFLKIAFKQPRKILMKNLSQHYPKEKLATIFSQLGLASNIRPHEASTSIYHQLYKRLKEKIDGEIAANTTTTAAPATKPTNSTKQ